MSHANTPRNADPAALAQFDAEFGLQKADEATVLQERIEASEFGRRCRHEWAAQKRREKTEHVIGEVLQVTLAPGAGALAAWKTKGGFPVGALINGVVGTGAKALSLYQPENATLRVIGKAGKVLLHSQISITTHNHIEDKDQ
ncbi:hypothetical protein PPSIR1_19077 [Plesiocystis pacifica SIR-1]|uniref:Uncharacterized protein n=1 Tax=Plesiocystis pacifica SIR-1 TaxID=391625 RepID=A6GGN2_9BACT|nr:hypothetical protein [Plesiocystis pacifica]EDM74992.1 hypothetical protein PPSIR1_19077 [Plesiocystis pacifica SIR-1]